MGNQRGWAWLDSDEGIEHDEALVPFIKKLAREWNELHNAEEQDRFRRQAMYEAGAEEQEPDFDSDEEAEAYKKFLQGAAKRNRTRFELIELQLSHLGARMMRPYEHWNEDEQLMEYLERDREGE